MLAQKGGTMWSEPSHTQQREVIDFPRHITYQYRSFKSQICSRSCTTGGYDLPSSYCRVGSVYQYCLFRVICSSSTCFLWVGPADGLCRPSAQPLTSCGRYGRGTKIVLYQIDDTWYDIIPGMDMSHRSVPPSLSIQCQRPKPSPNEFTVVCFCVNSITGDHS